MRTARNAGETNSAGMSAKIVKAKARTHMAKT
jgi:hypothetical protein